MTPLARPRSLDWDPFDHRHDGLGGTVHEPEAPEPTGLLDAKGRPLVRKREPIGFRRPNQ